MTYPSWNRIHSLLQVCKASFLRRFFYFATWLCKINKMFSAYYNYISCFFNILKPNSMLYSVKLSAIFLLLKSYPGSRIMRIGNHATCPLVQDGGDGWGALNLACVSSSSPTPPLFTPATQATLNFESTRRSGKWPSNCTRPHQFSLAKKFTLREREIAYTQFVSSLWYDREYISSKTAI